MLVAFDEQRFALAAGHDYICRKLRFRRDNRGSSLELAYLTLQAVPKQVKIPSMSPSPSEKPYAVRKPPGAGDTRRIFNLPGIVVAIFAVTALVFLLMMFAPTRMARLIEIAGAVSPRRFLAGPSANGGILGMIAPLFSHMLVHASIPHLLFNTLWLFALGSPVARRMGAEGALQSFAAFSRAMLFLSFYALSGAAGALTYIAMHMNEPTFLVGASGGVSGLLGGLVRFAFNRTSMLGPEYSKISPLFSSTVLIWTVTFIALNVAIGVFGDAIPGGGANIAWDAHIGGFLFGLLFYPGFEQAARSIR